MDRSNNKVSIDKSDYSPAEYKMSRVLWHIAFFIAILNSSCKKLIEIPPQIGTLTANDVFSNDDEAISAMAGIYYQMINTGDLTFSNGAISIYSGMSADELAAFNATSDKGEFQRNTISPINGIIAIKFWNEAFTIVYRANAIIEGLNNTNGVHDSLKTQLIGEAKFIRAFCNFYLINLFGDIPLVTTANWHKTSLLSRTNVADVYTNIISDLKEAKEALRGDYLRGNGQRVIPNKWAAAALLARVYLYTLDFINAEKEATLVINNTSLFNLKGNLKDVFNANSNEAIWQLQQNTNTTTKNATQEGFSIIPFYLTKNYPPNVVAANWTLFVPKYYILDTLVKAFEAKDRRKLDWMDSTGVLNGKNYYYSYKYKIGPSQAMPNGPEYYMVLRLAEQFLIKAEAEAHSAGGGLNAAITDLNVIRNRAGLPNYNGSASQDSVLDAIYHENQVEFFAEWGHRWLDLKRWRKADATLGSLKGNNWQTTDQLYPIPLGELGVDPNLTQNPGY